MKREAEGLRLGLRQMPNEIWPTTMTAVFLSSLPSIHTEIMRRLQTYQ